MITKRKREEGGKRRGEKKGTEGKYIAWVASMIDEIPLVESQSYTVVNSWDYEP